MERVKTPWSIPISVFKDYVFDNDRLERKTFEFDWSNCKIPRQIKDPEQQEAFKEEMRINYRDIRQTYKYYAAIGSSGGIFSVGQNGFTDLCSQTGVINSTTFKLADLDFNLKATLYTDVKNNPLNPGNALVRYEFMELIARIALDKYFKTGECPTQTLALRRLMQDMSPYMKEQDSDKWRW
jgi:hypothetical protein